MLRLEEIYTVEICNVDTPGKQTDKINNQHSFTAIQTTHQNYSIRKVKTKHIHYSPQLIAGHL